MGGGGEVRPEAVVMRSQVVTVVTEGKKLYGEIELYRTCETGSQVVTARAPVVSSVPGNLTLPIPLNNSIVRKSLLQWNSN